METEIRLFGNARSGHHAVATWISHSLKIPYIADNHPRIRNGIAHFKFEEKNLKEEKIIWSSDNYAPEHQIKTNLQAKNAIHVLSIRDPWNWLASWIISVQKWCSQAKIEEKLNKVIKSYKIQAKEALGDSNTLKNKVTINFNDWKAKKEYRKDIIGQLDGKSDESIRNVVTQFGGGSTFSRLKWKNNANQLETNKRYPYALNNKLYQKAIQDEELNQLGIRLFGSQLYNEVHASYNRGQ